MWRTGYTFAHQETFLQEMAVMAVQLVKKWGNSPAVRIPAAIMESAHLSLNQAVQVRASNGRVIIEPAAPSYDLETLLAGITPENCHLEVDFGSPQGKEFF
jgi:antitoxin MazE